MPVRNGSQELLEPHVFSNLFDLVGVMTTWICLQPNGETISKYQLLLADASTGGKGNSHIYRVGNRHSVGISFTDATKWFHVPRMSKGDAWIFDTMNCPHNSVDLKPDDNFERVSAEVRKSNCNGTFAPRLALISEWILNIGCSCCNFYIVIRNNLRFKMVHLDTLSEYDEVS